VALLPELEGALALADAVFAGPPPQFNSTTAESTTRTSVDRETFMGESFQG
jgi:hypothetical protein